MFAFNKSWAEMKYFTLGLACLVHRPQPTDTMGVLYIYIYIYIYTHTHISLCVCIHTCYHLLYTRKKNGNFEMGEAIQSVLFLVYLTTCRSTYL